MNFDADAAYQVFKARDARFDGRIFVGVTSTGVYCRPVCRVRTPRRENCRFFDTPAQAEAEAFRPCMKCRPEVAPGPGLAWTVMDASRTLARQAASWLDSRLGDEEALSMTGLADHLGVSDRHMRRIFATEHGVTPLQYLQTRRLLLAKQLLTDTRLPVAQVALASGFRSLRRFNAAFAESYRMSPSRLRGEVDEDAVPADDAINVRLGYRAPYDIASMLKFLGQRAIPDVEMVDGMRIRRTLRAGSIAPPSGWLEAEFVPETETRAPHVRLGFSPALAPHSARVVAAVRRWLDLDASPEAIDSTLAKRFVDRFGEPLATPWPEISHTFPSPAVIAQTPIEHIAELGIIRTRAGAIIALAQAWPEIAAKLHTQHQPEALIEALHALPGIGPWTAHYIAMRALGWPDAFPPQDVAVLNAMKPLFGVTTQREADALIERWRPWRAYAVLRLWNTLT
jgi:AraC family transcriptional regulator of adaptative response / DNA-3-methyladenine glycosylase II